MESGTTHTQPTTATERRNAKIKTDITNEIREYLTDDADLLGASFHCRAIADAIMPIIIEALDNAATSASGDDAQI